MITMKWAPLTIMLASTLAGCTLAGGSLPFTKFDQVSGKANLPPSPDQASASRNVGNRIGNLEFKAASTETVNRLSRGGTGKSGLAPTTGLTNAQPLASGPPNQFARTGAPEVTGSAGVRDHAFEEKASNAGISKPALVAPDDAPGGIGSSSRGSMFSYDDYFRGPFGPMKLESTTEATAPGTAGDWQTLQNDIILPIIASWAPDAGLVWANTSLDGEGNPLDSAPVEVGWHLTYAAPKVSEVMHFLVTPNKTTVVRLHWVPLHIDARVVAVDAKAALARVATALKDPKFTSKEDQFGFGYFFGKLDIAPKEGTVPVARPEEPSSLGVARDYAEEILYELPKGGQWLTSLQAIGDYTVWDYSYQVMMAEPMPLLNPTFAESGEAQTAGFGGSMVPVLRVPEPTSWTDYSVHAWVDAKTGEVLRLRRPRKITQSRVPIDPKNGAPGTEPIRILPAPDVAPVANN